MQESASGLALGWDRSPFEDENCDGLGVIDLGVFLPLDFPLGLDPLPLLSFGRLVLLRLPLIVLPLVIFTILVGLIPLYILGLRLYWTIALRSSMPGGATDCTSTWLSTWMILGTMASL